MAARIWAALYSARVPLAETPQAVCALLREKGWRVGNVDCTVVAPKKLKKL